MATKRFFFFCLPLPRPHSSSRSIFSTSTTKVSNPTIKKVSKTVKKKTLVEHLKKRTHFVTEFDAELYKKYAAAGGHVPVMLGEVLEVFCHSPLRSFVDCTLGAAGYSSAIIKMHGELELYIRWDIDPIAHEKGRARIEQLLKCLEGLKAYTHEEFQACKVCARWD